MSDPICSSAFPGCPTKKEAASHPKDYKVPNFGMDHDIIDTQKHIADEEKKHGKWTPVQDDNGKWEVPEAFNNKSYNYANV